MSSTQDTVRDLDHEAAVMVSESPRWQGFIQKCKCHYNND